MNLPDNIIPNDYYMGLKKLAAYGDMGVGTLRDHIRVGELPAYKVKGRILVKKSEFDAWIEQYRVNQKQHISDIADCVIRDMRKS